MGEESQAMIFAASSKVIKNDQTEEENIVLLFPEIDLPVGSKVY
jgi:tRNA-binding EMAP/Myf-like protein